jgi:hypothetical protein
LLAGAILANFSQFEKIREQPGTICKILSKILYKVTNNTPRLVIKTLAALQ